MNRYPQDPRNPQPYDDLSHLPPEVARRRNLVRQRLNTRVPDVTTDPKLPDMTTVPRLPNALQTDVTKNFVTGQETARMDELNKISRKAILPEGKPSETRDISSSARKVLGYSTHFMAQHATDVHSGADKVTKPLNKRVVGRLVRGTESMDFTRSVLNKGRGNVDGDDPNFPEAKVRSHLASKYARRGGSEHKKASLLELIRAGNCDHHATVSAIHAGGHLPDEFEHVSKVRYPGHAFTELRGRKGKTKVLGTDVIVDSWSSTEHGILRKDSEFATDMHPKKSGDINKAFTHYTADQITGLKSFQLKERELGKSIEKEFGQKMDEEAAALGKETVKKSFKSWDPTPSFSDAGQVNADIRESSFNRQSALTRNIQTVFTARQMGASIRGAAKHAKFSDVRESHRANSAGSHPGIKEGLREAFLSRQNKNK